MLECTMLVDDSQMAVGGCCVWNEFEVWFGGQGWGLWNGVLQAARMCVHSES
jgi:hypothetical protein